MDTAMGSSRAWKSSKNLVSISKSSLSRLMVVIFIERLDEDEDGDEEVKSSSKYADTTDEHMAT